MPSSSSTQTAFPFRLGIQRGAEFSGNENCISTRCLAGVLLYWQLSLASTAPCWADFIGTQPGISRKD